MRQASSTGVPRPPTDFPLAACALMRCSAIISRVNQAPLRAFSYTQAGGATSCGVRPNAVFKCPDGYAGSYPERLTPLGGYADFKCTYNPFSNKVVLLDEVHNLVRPSAEILRNEKRMLMLMRLRQLLRTAEKCALALCPRVRRPWARPP